MRKFILNADDLAKSKEHNRAIFEGYNFGLLKSTSMMANMPYYNDAIENVVQKCKNLGVGVHLNLIEGKSINQNLNLLCDFENNFNNGFIDLLIKSNDEKFLSQVENEFRSQIEKCLKDFKPTHLDSHVHTHSIPNIFKIVCKLASEYGIKQVRTQNEKPYFIFEKRYDLKTYLINQIKVYLLKYFTYINKKEIEKYNLKTNDYLIGVSYTSMMDSTTILEGIKAIKGNYVVEALIHPCKYNDNKKDSHSIEFEITQDEMLKDLIEKNLGYEISRY